MSTTRDASFERDPDHEQAPATPSAESRQPQPAQGARWWFVFDRWLAVTDVADGQDHFVMA